MWRMSRKREERLEAGGCEGRLRGGSGAGGAEDEASAGWGGVDGKWAIRQKVRALHRRVVGLSDSQRRDWHPEVWALTGRITGCL